MTVLLMYHGQLRKMDGRIREYTLSFNFIYQALFSFYCCYYYLLILLPLIFSFHRIQTNVISTFMLATLLVPLLLKTAKLPAPVANVHLKPHLVTLTSACKFY